MSLIFFVMVALLQLMCVTQMAVVFQPNCFIVNHDDDNDVFLWYGTS